MSRSDDFCPCYSYYERLEIVQMKLLATHEQEKLVDEYARIKIEIDNRNERMNIIADELKRAMEENECDEIIAGSHTVAYKPVTSKRIDTTELKKFFGEDALEPFTKTTSSMRFSVK